VDVKSFLNDEFCFEVGVLSKAKNIKFFNICRC
jgi:hypothetical protein